MSFVINKTYNWKYDPATILIYLGKNWSGNGYWHQFSKVENPDVIWCEVTDAELPMIEESAMPPESNSQRKKRIAREFNEKRESDAIEREKRIIAKREYDATPEGQRENKLARAKLTTLLAMASAFNCR